jgi:hypothetical protein
MAEYQDIPLHYHANGQATLTQPEELESFGLEVKDEAYQKGFWAGYHQLSKEPYEGALSEQMQAKVLEEEIQSKKIRLQDVEKRLEEAALVQHQTLKEKQLIQHSLNFKLTLKSRREQELQKITKQQERYQQEAEELRTKHPFLAGILFLIAGFIFILGDLIISHEIVAYALNIKNNIEAWSFAVGLAMVSVLLKPAYDRLIELPYIQNKRLSSKVIYTIFKIFIVVFTIITLLVLGLFRYEAYKTDKLKETLTQSILLEQNEELSQEQMDKIKNKTETLNSLNQQLVNTPSGLYAFVLSGILFAIAGAVCLGISFPILVSYTRIWFQIPMASKKLRVQQANFQKIIEEIEEIISQTAAQLAVQDAELNRFEPVKELRKQQAELMEEIAQKQKIFYQKQNEERFFRFAEGYERGALWREEQRLRAQEAELAALRLKEAAQKAATENPDEAIEASLADSESALSETVPSTEESEMAMNAEETSEPMAESPKPKSRSRKKALAEETVEKPKRSRNKKIVNKVENTIENTPSESNKVKENALSNSVLDKVNKRRNTPRT